MRTILTEVPYFVFRVQPKGLTILLYFGKVTIMPANMTKIWDSKPTQQFVESLVAIDDVTAMQNFLRDVMTEKEIIEISARLEAARMLREGAKYSDVIAKTKLSSRTVARISDWMQNGCGGYAVVLDQINDHSHISPARAA